MIFLVLFLNELKYFDPLFKIVNLHHFLNLNWLHLVHTHHQTYSFVKYAFFHSSIEALRELALHFNIWNDGFYMLFEECEIEVSVYKPHLYFFGFSIFENTQNYSFCKFMLSLVVLVVYLAQEVLINLDFLQ